MKDVLLFLITFAVIMIAFSSGVSYIFNMASGKIKANKGQASEHDFISSSLSSIIHMAYLFDFKIPTQYIWPKSEYNDRILLAKKECVFYLKILLLMYDCWELWLS